jgi:hypothetical protein
VLAAAGTLQNVAVISSIQNTPVVGTWDGANRARGFRSARKLTGTGGVVLGK